VLNKLVVEMALAAALKSLLQLAVSATDQAAVLKSLLAILVQVTAESPVAAIADVDRRSVTAACSASCSRRSLLRVAIPVHATAFLQDALPAEAPQLLLQQQPQHLWLTHMLT
jgi:hypothetical protein